MFLLLGALTAIGIIGLQCFYFLADGQWYWMAIADLMALAGYNPLELIDPLQTWEWVGIGKVINWSFYTAPASLIAFVAGVALDLILGFFLNY
ncbi:hypothetical protein [Microbaculum marinisediminis]|uniref:Uncharacterized protein n=1 Tax=Microbaculum marinisediminis TaxID=2931392 RepID=A0AAW5QX43_9HYPH|nr:hypothetical protein [Microbaculum sp. A6E488]MCT8971228.1 hypothetical protein [Microbaculum sp. A6E488]